MKGIKPHTHEERGKIVEKLVPLIKKRFGSNFVALATEGSYARKEDRDYSDLELIVFLKKIPKGVDWSIRKIVDGLLVVIVPDTKNSFIKKYIEVSDVWYASAGSRLLPIVNNKFIEEINNFKPDNLGKKCWDHAVKRWNQYQEITAKVLNGIKQENKELVTLAFSQMVKELLVILSFINTTPYKTLGTYISQANGFPLKPRGFMKLIDIFIDGKYQDLPLLADVIDKAFSDMERIFEQRGVKLYSNSIL